MLTYIYISIYFCVLHLFGSIEPTSEKTLARCIKLRNKFLHMINIQERNKIKSEEVDYHDSTMSYLSFVIIHVIMFQLASVYSK